MDEALLSVDFEENIPFKTKAVNLMSYVLIGQPSGTSKQRSSSVDHQKNVPIRVAVYNPD